MSTINFNERDWISQAEAARLRGVTRQAISKLVQKRKIKTFEIGGHTLVYKKDVLSFQPQKAGRPALESTQIKTPLIDAIETLNIDAKKQIFNLLRNDIKIHPLETEFNAPAEVILEAISRSSDLTKRGVRGIIAEATFKVEVLDNLIGWKDITPDGDHAFDFLIEDKIGRISIQVKMQRKKAQRPMFANEGYRRLPPDQYVVETQKTRGGINPATGEDTRPYRFGEFDIIAVSMEPSTNDWKEFRYTVSDWLIPRDDKPEQMLKFQPVSLQENDDWTRRLTKCIGWLRKQTIKKRIMGG